MNVSYNWLNRHIDITEFSPGKIGDILTALGLEVEGMEEYSSVKGGLKGVLTGKVIDCKPHPDADRLKVTEVQLEGAESVQIVCGAPNVSEGQTVAVATVGSTLYPDGKEIEIKKATIRGVDSAGMICAEDELNLGESYEGIMVLPEEYKIGQPLSDYIEVVEDTIYDVGLTPNRSDATHHRGIARDLLAYFTLHMDGKYILKPLDISIPEIMVNKEISVEIKNPEDCPRYAGVVLDSISHIASPLWMQHLLKSIGIKPSNCIVDITNFILHDMGQPLHAFDYDKISGNKIEVKHLPEGTEFTSLDRKKISLNESDLMICDGDNNGMCIAGVYGGLESSVTEETTTIFLESAHFKPESVRKTSMKHDLRTDAARVFEKGSDPTVVDDALKRASSLLVQYADAEVASEIQEVYTETIVPEKIRVRYNRAEKLIGVQLGADKIKEILSALNMNFTSEKRESVTVEVPTDKADVTREVDVIEEILRVYGFYNIPASANEYSFLNPISLPEPFTIKKEINNLLQARGFLEMMNVSLTDSSYYDDQKKLVHINNTSNQNLDILRPDMIVSALETARYNINRKEYNLKFYEWGKSYKYENDCYIENTSLSLLLSGNSRKEHWQKDKADKYSFYSIKGYVNLLFERLGINSYQTDKISDDKYFSYGLKYHRGPMELAVFGKVKSTICDQMDVDQDSFVAIIDWDIIKKNLPSSRIHFTEINKFPAMSRDLALVADKSVEYREIKDIVHQTLQPKLADLSVFDIYEDDEQLGTDKRSIAIRMKLENKNRTLTDEEVDSLIDKLMKNLQSELSIALR